MTYIRVELVRFHEHGLESEPNRLFGRKTAGNVSKGTGAGATKGVVDENTTWLVQNQEGVIDQITQNKIEIDR